MNTGGPAFPQHGWSKDPEVLRRMQDQGGMTLLDWFAGQALAGFFGFISETQANLKDADLPGIKREQVARECYEQAEAMLAEKARREAVVQESLTIQDAGKMVWKQSPKYRSAIVCETQFSYQHSDNSNVLAYGGFLVAESVPEEAKALIIQAPQLEAANRELVEALEGCLESLERWCPVKHREARAILSKHKESK